jgi:hypothetical protein
MIPLKRRCNNANIYPIILCLVKVALIGFKVFSWAVLLLCIRYTDDLWTYDITASALRCCHG